MTTLTAHTLRLPEHCPHKLPTSCRMSVPQCCACSDKRPHSLSYLKYIDGIGFVSQGSRHQNYCSYCRDFWTARITASDLSRSSDARIPSIPDQTAFIEKWFEWHRGYTYVTDEHGDQELRGLIGERLDQVPPGYLPRTIDELNADRSNPLHQYGVTRSEGLPTAAHDTQYSDTSVTYNTSGISPQDLDSEDRLLDPSSTAAHSPYQARQIVAPSDPLASLRHELQRILTRIDQFRSGLQGLGEDHPDSEEILRRSGVLNNRLQEINGQLDELQRTRMSTPRPNVSTNAGSLRDPSTNQSQAGTTTSNRNIAITAPGDIRANIETVQDRHASARAERDNAILALQRAEAEVEEATNARRGFIRQGHEDEAAVRVFGTREEVEREGADYESPVGEMFTRAFERYRAAEDAQQGERVEGSSELELERTSDRSQQRPREMGGRPGAVPEAGGSHRAVRPVPHPTPSGPLPPSFPQHTTHTNQHQTGGLSAGTPPYSTSAAATPVTRHPPPLFSRSQPSSPQADTTVQTQSPIYTPTSPHYSRYIPNSGAGSTAQAHDRAYTPTSPHFSPPLANAGAYNALHTLSQGYAPSAPHYPGLVEDFGAWRERMLAVEASFGTDSMNRTRSTYSQGQSRYTTRPSNAIPRHHPSPPITYPPVHPVTSQTPPHRISSFQTATTPSEVNSWDNRSASNAQSDFSTIAPDAARMQDAASQAQRRIIRDIRARRHGHLPPTTSGSSDNSPIASGAYVPTHPDLLDNLSNFSNHQTHGSRSEDSASDSGDVTALMERLRRRRNAVGEIDDTRPSLRTSMAPEAMEATIANFRARRQAGLSAAIDQLLERDDASAEEQGPKGLDRDDGRPEPRSEEQMMVNMECKICFSQLATVAVLPCGEWMLLEL